MSARVEVGDKVEDFALPDETGTVRHLSELLADGPVQLDLRADSFPLQSLPPLTPVVTELAGRLRGEATVRGIEAGQVRIGVRIAEIVDGHDADFICPLRFVKRAQDVAPDTTITIDCHFNRHDDFS